MPGLGANITWNPTNNFKILTNDYYGSDAAAIPARKRFHSITVSCCGISNGPNSNGISQMAFSLTGDIGFEKGGGVNGFKNSATDGPAQYFASVMFYNRTWFAKNKFAWTIGGGLMNNPRPLPGTLSNGTGQSLAKSGKPNTG